MYGVQTEAFFDSAHFLPDYYGRCENLHGHRWRLVVTLKVAQLQTEGTMAGMVLDFSAFKQIVREFAEGLDHRFIVQEGSLKPATLEALKDEGFELLLLPFRTTAENLARYAFEELTAKGLPVARVQVDETPNNQAFYEA